MQIWAHTCAHLHTKYKYTLAHRNMHVHTCSHANTPKHNACMWTYTCKHINTHTQACILPFHLVDMFLKKFVGNGFKKSKCTNFNV